VLAALLLAACGSGSSSQSSGGGGGNSMFPDRGGGETVEPPPSARTARIGFDSATGERCCVAIDAELIPAGALFVLDDLPAGPGTVRVAFFAGDFAPAIEGVGATCATVTDTGRPCDPQQVASPSFESAPTQVVIVPGGQTNVTDLVINALPFVADFAPPNAETVENPVQFTFTVADAVTSVEPESVALEITVQIPDGPVFRPLTKRLPLELTPCNDSGETQCSTAGDLDLEGFLANSAPVSLVSGPVDVRILALNLGEPPQAVDFRYGFDVAADSETEP
jgi:hypothetical protein